MAQSKTTRKDMPSTRTEEQKRGKVVALKRRKVIALHC
jgi:hypothetical protein